MPIETVYFDSIDKFDGVEVRELYQQETMQVGGRYGIYDQGYVSGMDPDDHVFLKNALGAQDKTRMLDRFLVSPSYDLIEECLDMTGNSLSDSVALVFEYITVDEKKYVLHSPDHLIENIKFMEHATRNEPLEPSVVWKIAHIPLQLDDCEDVFKQCLSIMQGLGMDVVIEDGVLGSNRSFEALYKEYQVLHAKIDCVSWFMSTMGMSPSNHDYLSITKLLEQLVSKMNKEVAKRGRC